MPESKSAFGATDGLLLLMATIWGINFTSVKYGSLAMSPVTFTWLRVTCAMVTLMLMALLQRKPWPARRDVLTLIALGILGNGIYQLLFVNGVARSRVADSALLVATAPAFIAALSRVQGVERIRFRAIVGIVLSIAGVATVVLGAVHEQPDTGSLLGAGLVCLSVVCWSVFTVLLEPYTRRTNPIQLNALTMAGGVLPLLFVTSTAFSGSPLAHVSWKAWGALFYSSVISMGLAYLFWYRGVRVLGPTRTSVYGNLQPVIAILFAWAVLQESPTLWQGVGAATIIAGIVLTRL
jgi:drug/metabolite transporter (DMT)-like permease